MTGVETLAWVSGDWEVVEAEADDHPVLAEELAEVECNGLCLTPYDIGIDGHGGIAYPHPGCPLHSWKDLYDPVRNEEDIAAQRHVPDD